MAITFNKLKSPKLDLLDKFTFGKFQDCRVCDILPENYEYVLWLHEKSPYMFTTVVVSHARQLKMETVAKIHKKEEEDPYNTSSPWFDSSWDDDIPF